MKVDRDPTASGWQSIKGRALLWAAALALTYAAGKLAVDLVKWAVLAYAAPGGEAKLIMVGYLVGPLFLVLLAGVPAAFAWHRLFRRGERVDAALVLGLELAFLAYVGIGDVQRALAEFF